MEAICEVGRWGEPRGKWTPPRGSHWLLPSRGPSPLLVAPSREALSRSCKYVVEGVGGYPVMERQSVSIHFECPNWHIAVCLGLVTDLFKG